MIIKKNSEYKKNKDIKAETLKKTYKEIRWNILERFSRITRFSYEKTKTIIDASFSKNSFLSNFSPQLQKFINSEHTINIIEEYDIARLYLARWAAKVVEDSERDKFNKIILNNGNTNTWDEKIFNNFEMMELKTFENNINIQHKEPISEEQWKSWFDYNGKLLITKEEIKKAIFYRGIHFNIRKEIWCFLLEIYPWDSSLEEREMIFLKKKDMYIQLKQKWQNNQEKNTDKKFEDQKHRIEKDVHRTDKQTKYFTNNTISNDSSNLHFSENDPHLETMKNILLTYNEHNTDLGYVQGMCDLLSPLYAVMKNEVLSFWAFVNFMKRMQYNFFKDQSGMRKQLIVLDQLIQLMNPKFYKHLESASSTNLFFFFRMLLVWFKREFEWDDVLQLWERLWTNYITPHFHLFVALAIIDKHKDVIMDHLKTFDEILKYVNDLSMTIDLKSTLQRAEFLFRKFQKIAEIIDINSSNQPSISTNRFEKHKNNIKGNPDYSHIQDQKSPFINDYLRELLNTDYTV